MAVIIKISLNRDSDHGSMGMQNEDSMGMHHNSGAATYTGADVMFFADDDSPSPTGY